MISYRLCAVFLGLKGKLVKLQSESEAMLGKAIVLSGSTRSPVNSVNSVNSVNCGRSPLGKKAIATSPLNLREITVRNSEGF